MITNRRNRGFFLFALAVLSTLVVAAPASALPVFARKYQTSCQTCHTIFPKLNPFGQAFRLNGYRMPAETEEMIKEKPVSLGADAYAKMWPSAVFPSSLPSDAPFAMNMKLADLYASSHDESGRTIIHNDFQFPQEVNLFSAGTLGDNFSFLGEVTYGQLPDGGSEVEIEHAQINWDSPFGPTNAVHVKIGKFAPDYADGFQEMWLMTNNGIDTMFAYNPIGYRGGTGLGEDGTGISLPSLVQGIEVYGVLAHRFFYTVGMVNGMGPGPNDTFDGNSRKDLYARMDWKFGGMGLDGDTGGSELPPQNWRETSLRLGVFAYAGDGRGIDFEVQDDDGNTLSMQDRRYDRIGGYASAMLSDLNLIGGYVRGNDRLRLSDPETGEMLDETKRNYDAWYAQADYVIAPPFQCSVRYENLRPADKSADSLRLVNANFSWLVRANIKLMLEYNRDLRDAKNYQLATVLRFAY